MITKNQILSTSERNNRIVKLLEPIIDRKLRKEYNGKNVVVFDSHDFPGDVISADLVLALRVVYKDWLIIIRQHSDIVQNRFWETIDFS